MKHLLNLFTGMCVLGGILGAVIIVIGVLSTFFGLDIAVETFVFAVIGIGILIMCYGIGLLIREEE